MATSASMTIVLKYVRTSVYKLYSNCKHEHLYIFVALHFRAQSLISQSWEINGRLHLELKCTNQQVYL